MTDISNRDIETLKEKVIDGCQQFIFDFNYIDKFLEINNINFEPDSIIFFKNKNYSNYQIFQIIFLNCLIRNYSDIDIKLLDMIKKIAISNN